ncbi:glucosamine kinase [Yoonia maricola]|uniref:Glucosamine kinase n=1 Tax=Yoonia maricola TaxID=420999 RepID=A0A2M8W506_9RHOB|nr:BadF/BadG/BcrA/BcrD ATPase family protein [Yoonia maricola]PJI86017.1 glucosamine kinase [Yoonia maricola]
MKPVDYILGIDGGGTGCRLSVCDREGRQLALVTGGPANFTTDPDVAIQNILQTMKDAKSRFPKGKLDLASCAAHIGLAGIMQKSDADTVAAALPFADLTVTDDRTTSVAGALGSADGVVVSVGTGSFVAAQRSGSQCFLGGWGLALGDQASGAWLGLEALRRAVLAYEGLAAKTDLTEQLMLDYGGTPLGVLTFTEAAQPADFAAIAPGVIAAARSGDQHGLDLMHEGARYLMLCLQEMKIAKADMVCLTGGIGPHYAAYLDPEVTSRIQPPKGTALDGAVHLAQQLL